MPLSSGALSFDNTSGNLLSGRTSGWATPSLSNVSLSSFNRGGTYIPSTGLSPNSNVPLTVGAGNSLSLNTLRGCYIYTVTTFNFTVGTSYYTSGKFTFYRYGFGITNFDGTSLAFGTAPSPNTFTTPSGTHTIRAFYHDSGYHWLWLSYSANGNTDNDFVQVSASGYNNNNFLTRSAGASYSPGSTYRYWYWSNSNYPTSGSSTLTLRYYG